MTFSSELSFFFNPTNLILDEKSILGYIQTCSILGYSRWSFQHAKNNKHNFVGEQKHFFKENYDDIINANIILWARQQYVHVSSFPIQLQFVLWFKYNFTVGVSSEEVVNFRCNKYRYLKVAFEQNMAFSLLGCIYCRNNVLWRRIMVALF